MKPITKKHLESIVERINRMQDMKLEPWAKLPIGKHGRFVANVGTYHLGWAYGGASLLRMDNESGGVQDVLSCGHIPKRELSERLFAFIRGLEEKK